MAPNVGETRPIANQAARRHEFAPFVDRRNGMTRRERYELLAPAIEEGIGADDECTNVQLHKGGEGSIDRSFGAGCQDTELQPPRARRFLHVSNHWLGIRS